MSHLTGDGEGGEEEAVGGRVTVWLMPTVNGFFSLIFCFLFLLFIRSVSGFCF